MSVVRGGGREGREEVREGERRRMEGWGRRVKGDEEMCKVGDKTGRMQRGKLGGDNAEREEEKDEKDAGLEGSKDGGMDERREGLVEARNMKNWREGSWRKVRRDRERKEGLEVERREEEKGKKKKVI